jgi:hypothetical protein
VARRECYDFSDEHHELIEYQGGVAMRKDSQMHRIGWIGGIVPLAILLAVALSSHTTTASPPTACCVADPGSRSASVGTPACVDFEDLILGTNYAVGASFIDSGVVVNAHPFVWSNGTAYSGGFAQVGNAGFAGGSGLEIQANNINLELDFGGSLTGLSFRFGEYGGNLNIEINGDFRNFNNFSDIDGLTIGGVSVSATNGLGNDKGQVRLSGPIDSLIVGGQELWIDDICPETDCVDFEDLTASTTYNVGDTFVDSGVTIQVDPFVWSNGTVYSGGFAQVGSTGLAGGSGLELQVNNVNLTFDFGQSLKGLSLDFGEYGGNLNIEINGDFRNFNNFADINGLVIGDAQVVVLNGLGNDTGRLYLFGTIDSFAVGGQELWIDNICPATCCVEFESLPLSTSYNVSDSFSDSCAKVSIEPFVWNNGTVYSGGYARVGNSALAGGTGQEMQVNNVNLAFDYGASLKRLTLVFGEYGGNLNIDVNGDFRNFDNFDDIDGATIGGATVAVANGLGNDKGRLELTGIIHSFAVGGQELWVDNVCIETLESRIFLPTILKGMP